MKTHKASFWHKQRYVVVNSQSEKTTLCQPEKMSYYILLRKYMAVQTLICNHHAFPFLKTKDRDNHEETPTTIVI